MVQESGAYQYAPGQRVPLPAPLQVPREGMFEKDVQGVCSEQFTVSIDDILRAR